MIEPFDDDFPIANRIEESRSPYGYLARVFTFTAGGLAVAATAALAVGEVRGFRTPGGQLTVLGWALVLAPVAVAVAAEILARFTRRVSIPGAATFFLVQAALVGAALDIAGFAFGTTTVAIALVAAMAGFGVLALLEFSIGPDLPRAGMFVTPIIVGSVLATAMNLWIGFGGLEIDVAEFFVFLISAIVFANLRRLLAIYERARPSASMGDLACEATATLAIDPFHLLSDR